MIDAIWKTITHGGPFMYPIALLSVVMWYMIMERYLFLRRAAKPSNFLDSYIDSMKVGRTADALGACVQDSGFCASIVRKAHEVSMGEVRKVAVELEMESVSVFPEFDRRLSFIKVLVAIAPLLGLLGTVNGMIGTFDTITSIGTGDVSAMSGGISEALITTEAGLLVAIAGLGALQYLSMLARRSRHELELLRARISSLLSEKAGVEK